MSTKIFYNDNRIIIDGHADTAEECRAITAMCDSLANNENFETIAYESGHAVFEQVSGGESEMFAMQNYVLTSKYESEVGADYPTAKGVIKDRLDILESAVSDLEARLAALEGKTEYKLPYTASELVEKLSAL